jgi:hypothetical protein
LSVRRFAKTADPNVWAAMGSVDEV